MLQILANANRLKFVLPLTALLTAGCGSVFDTTAPTVSNADVVKNTADMEIPLTTVRQNAVFAETMIKLYDTKTASLRSYGYVSSIPYYAAAVATGAVMLHGADTNILADLGLGVGSYFGLNQSLDFNGRAEVLSDATVSWQCFADLARRVDFLDPMTDGSDTATEKRIIARYDYLNRNLRKARAYLATGANVDADTVAGLNAAITVAEKALPVAESDAKAARNIVFTLAKYRRQILRMTASAYSGKMRPFAYKTSMDSISTNANDLVQYKTKLNTVREALSANPESQGEAPPVAGGGAPVVPPAPAPAVAPAPAAALAAGGQAPLQDVAAAAALTNAKISQAKDQKEAAEQQQADALPSLPSTGDKNSAANISKATRSMRAMTYRLIEMSGQVTSDLDGAALAELPLEMSKCMPVFQ